MHGSIYLQYIQKKIEILSKVRLIYRLIYQHCSTSISSMEKRSTRIKYFKFLASKVNMGEKISFSKFIKYFDHTVRSSVMYERFHPRFTCKYIHIYTYISARIDTRERINCIARPARWRGVKKRVNHFVCAIYLAKFNKKKKYI